MYFYQLDTLNIQNVIICYIYIEGYVLHFTTDPTPPAEAHESIITHIFLHFPHFNPSQTPKNWASTENYPSNTQNPKNWAFVFKNLVYRKLKFLTQTPKNWGFNFSIFGLPKIHISNLKIPNQQHKNKPSKIESLHNIDLFQFWKRSGIFYYTKENTSRKLQKYIPKIT